MHRTEVARVQSQQNSAQRGCQETYKEEKSIHNNNNELQKKKVKLQNKLTFCDKTEHAAYSQSPRMQNRKQRELGGTRIQNKGVCEIDRERREEGERNKVIERGERTN